MRRLRYTCVMCDQHKVEKDGDWCDFCKQEFEEKRAKMSCTMKVCVTPISCMGQRKCLARSQYATNK